LIAQREQRLFGWVLLLFVSVTVLAARSQPIGSFDGELVFKWGRDGRTMTLLNPFSYTDPKRVVWEVPSGAITDGASIPRILWTIAGGPFEGKYRDAAVIHDYYCEVQTRPWRDTHLVFYNAMRTAGVDDVTAKTFYAAVYYFGPRWGIGTASKGPGAQQSLTLDQERQVVDNLRAWIEKSDPDVAQISELLDSSDPAALRQ
jgi:Protein of unknown function (DUF1353)